MKHTEEANKTPILESQEDKELRLKVINLLLANNTLSSMPEDTIVPTADKIFKYIKNGLTKYEV